MPREARRRTSSRLQGDRRARPATAIYDAVDFTPQRVPEGTDHAVVLQLHGPPSGHVDRRRRQRHLRRPPARPLPQRSGDRGGRTAAAGKGAARHPDRHRQDRGRRARPRTRPRSRSPDTRIDPRSGAGAARDQRHVERPLFGDGDGDRLRLQPLERACRHPLAARSDRGPARHLHLPARRRDRRLVVGDGRAEAAPRRTRARRCSPTTRRASSRRSATLRSRGRMHRRLGRQWRRPPRHALQ